MKRGLLLLLTILSVQFANSQCTPDTTITSYIYPPVLPDAKVDSVYDVNVYFRAPKDSTIDIGGTVYNIVIDSVWVPAIVFKADSVKVPATSIGFTWVCNTPRCTWKGGEFGCAKFSGTPNSTAYSKYEIWVYVFTYARVVGLGTLFTRIDSSKIDLNIKGGRVFSVNEFSENTLYFKIFPNPSSQKAKIYLNSVSNEIATVSVFDVTGKLFSSFELDMRKYENEIDVSQLSKGIYFLKIKSETAGSGFAKLLIE